TPLAVAFVAAAQPRTAGAVAGVVSAAVGAVAAGIARGVVVAVASAAVMVARPAAGGAHLVTALAQPAPAGIDVTGAGGEQFLAECLHLRGPDGVVLTVVHGGLLAASGAAVNVRSGRPARRPRPVRASGT